jgi:hypothetical protein
VAGEYGASIGEYEAPVADADENQRVSQIMGLFNSPHGKMHSVESQDVVRVSLDAAFHAHVDDDKLWNPVYANLRTSHFCAELHRIPSDPWIPGKPVWVELNECELRREPYLGRLPNGLLFLPVFCLEEYMIRYFGMVEAWDSLTVPHPRGGSQAQVYNSLPFPVNGAGPLRKLSALATVAIPGVQVPILVNPGQRSSKFLSFPEMHYLEADVSDNWVPIATFDTKLRAVFNTVSSSFERLTPSQAREHVQQLNAQRLKDRNHADPPTRDIPMIAQAELQLLLYNFLQVKSVWVRTVELSRLRKLLSKHQYMVQIDVVTVEGKRDLEVEETIRRWSFIDEFELGVNIEFMEVDPPSGWCLYDTIRDGKLFRQIQARRGPSLADRLAYHEELLPCEK